MLTPQLKLELTRPRRSVMPPRSSIKLPRPRKEMLNKLWIHSNLRSRPPLKRSPKPELQAVRLPRRETTSSKLLSMLRLLTSRPLILSLAKVTSDLANIRQA